MRFFKSFITITIQDVLLSENNQICVAHHRHVQQFVRLYFIPGVYKVDLVFITPLYLHSLSPFPILANT